MSTYNDQECVRPPYGWTCTRGNGHPGPCAAHVIARRPDPDVVAAYERAVAGVEMAVLARAPRWARIRGLDDTSRRALAELFAEALTVAQETTR